MQRVLSGSFAKNKCRTIEKSHNIFSKLFFQIYCVICGSLGMVSVALFITTSGCILPQLEESNEDLQITENQGSWFGMDTSCCHQVLAKDILKHCSFAGVCGWYPRIIFWWI